MPQRRSLFDSMSNHIANSVSCDPEMIRSATSTTVPTLTWLPAMRKPSSTKPSTRPTSVARSPNAVEEHERVEVPDDVLLAQAPEEAAQEQPRDARDDAAIADARALADAVHRTGREVAHARVPDVQVHEHVVREPVARVHALEVELREHRPADRRVARLRVGDVPVAGRDLRQHRQHRVAEVARARDELPRLAGEEPVRLRVVELAARDRLDERKRGRRDPSGCRRP